MVDKPNDDSFTAHVEAGFGDSGIWIIRASLKFKGSTPPVGSKLLGEARLILLMEIMKAGKRGRELGAINCRIHFETDDRVCEYALVDDPPRFLSPN